MSTKEELMERVDGVWPAPGYRGTQQETVAKCIKTFEDKGKKFLLLDAPTGSGKSLLNYTTAKAVDKTGQGHDSKQALQSVADSQPGTSQIPEPLNSGAFYTTPLNTLVDQLDTDEWIQDKVHTIKGRSNYQCIHPEDSGTPVNEAICQREDNFDCEYKFQCPYYGRKYEGLQHPFVTTNMSYLMAEGMIPGTVKGTFGNRDILIVDECQKLEGFALNFISFTISKYSVPEEVWSNINIPTPGMLDWAGDDEDIEENWKFIKQWLKDEVLEATSDMLSYLDSQPMLTADQSSTMQDLQQFQARVENFLEDIKENDWIADIQREVNKNRPNTSKFVFEPVDVGRFMQDMLWSRADMVLLSSATIPKGGWLSDIGINPDEAGHVKMESMFPVENRPVIVDEAVGEMTSKKREETAPDMAKKIKNIAEYHGNKGMVHCRAYSIMELLKRAFYTNGDRRWFEENVMMQDKDDREGSLEDWQNSDKDVFLSVAMDEGVDLEGDRARWQVLAKVLFKSLGNKRVRYRLYERGEQDWYNRHAAIQIQQAYGRAVRSPDDEAVFYILDSSAVEVIRQNKHLFEEWFLEAIQW